MCITSCGRVVCDGCCARLRENNCRNCRGSCQVIPLSSKAPQNVLNLFKEISGQLKNVFKNLAFQENQKQSILDYKDRMIMKLGQEGKQQDLEIARLQELQRKRQVQLKDLEQKELSLRATLNSLTSEPCELRQAPPHNGHQRQMSSAFYAGMEELSPARNLYGPKILDSSVRSDGSSGSRGRREQGAVLSPRGDFLNMKTPGGWHKVGGSASPVRCTEGRRGGTGGFFTGIQPGSGSGQGKDTSYLGPGYLGRR